MVSKSVISQTALPGESLSATDVECLIDQVCPAKDYRGKKVLLIVPDGTRTAPIGLLFKALYEQIGVVAKAFDVLIALGTHPPMSEAAICQRLDLTLEERAQKYAGVNVFNHEWKTLQIARMRECCWFRKLGRRCFACANRLPGQRRVKGYGSVLCGWRFRFFQLISRWFLHV